MPTIKRKVEMNLPQLIEWGLKNEITSKEYTCNNKDGYKSVIFSTTGTVHLNSFQTYLADDKYKVEVEEEITGDTVLPESLVVFEHNGNLYTERHNSKCISKLLCLDKKVKGSDTKTIYILNEGGTLTLIWTKEEGLVE